MEIHGLSMLNCLITIGDEDPNDTLHILNKITVNEVVNLQIKDSYQTLINTAQAIVGVRSSTTMTICAGCTKLWVTRIAYSKEVSAST